MRRIKYGKEPVLHVHRYILAIGRKTKKGWTWGFRYVANLKEVREARDEAAKGSIVEVYEAHHNFREAWKK